MKRILNCIVLSLFVLAVHGQFTSNFDNAGDYPLLGDWKGEWIDPQKGAEKNHPSMAAQVDIIDGSRYRVSFLPALYRRATRYLEIEVDEHEQQISYEKDGWNFVMAGDSCVGFGNLHGDLTYFKLKKHVHASPTLGIPPPEDAIDLLAGDGLEQWTHNDGRDQVSWKLSDGVLETVSRFWNKGQNQEDGLGGSIRTKEDFGDLHFHMEFRYPVEPGKSGQGRGNSGLFFHGIGEIQILNSYALQGYWNEAGAIYRRWPAKVNAAGPPLVWQTYDVELILPRFNADGDKLSEAILTVRLNGILIHSSLEMNSNAARVSIGLQDHINCLQYRNIWVKEIQ